METKWGCVMCRSLRLLFVLLTEKKAYLYLPLEPAGIIPLPVVPSSDGSAWIEREVLIGWN